MVDTMGTTLPRRVMMSVSSSRDLDGACSGSTSAKSVSYVAIGRS
jgi:hypothetical protein